MYIGCLDTYLVHTFIGLRHLFAFFSRNPGLPFTHVKIFIKPLST